MGGIGRAPGRVGHPPRAPMPEAGVCDTSYGFFFPMGFSYGFFSPQPADRSRKSLAHMVAGQWEPAKGKMSAVTFVTLPKTFRFAAQALAASSETLRNTGGRKDKRLQLNANANSRVLQLKLIWPFQWKSDFLGLISTFSSCIRLK